MRTCLTRAARRAQTRPLRSCSHTTQIQRYRSVQDGHAWSTPLARQLAEAITTTGPISVAAFMRQCLVSDLGGYYTSQVQTDKDQFGVKGDFITSPEISQVFGELIGLWIVAEWISQGRKSSGIYLMEVGPGRGTLMSDVLRTIRNFPDLLKAIDTVYMVEASSTLSRAQHKLLCGEHTLEKTEIGQQSTSLLAPDLTITWTEDIRFVPRSAEHTPFIVAHEFFDALPIHVFRSIPPQSIEQTTLQTPTGPIAAPRRLPQASNQHQWRELVVSAKPPHRLKAGEAEFEMSVAKAATPHSMYLPETSDRYKALTSTTDATIEISPESQAYIREFAERLGGSNDDPEVSDDTASVKKQVSAKRTPQTIRKSTPSGAALIIDYGKASTIPTNSLRGIRSHQRVSPFDAPGATDVSADVDFMSLAETAINASPGVEVHGPVDQARFLNAMGIEERVSQLVKRAVDRERAGSTGQARSDLTDLVKRVEGGWKRLVDTSPQGMGRLYQVMAILPYTGVTKRRPVGFGGDVSE